MGCPNKIRVCMSRAWEDMFQVRKLVLCSWEGLAIPGILPGDAILVLAVVVMAENDVGCLVPVLTALMLPGPGHCVPVESAPRARPCTSIHFFGGAEF